MNVGDILLIFLQKLQVVYDVLYEESSLNVNILEHFAVKPQKHEELLLFD